MDIAVNPTYIRNCELKNRVQEERCIKIKENRQTETNFTPIRHYQANMPPDPTQKQDRKSNSNSLNADRKPPKDNYEELPSRVSNSVTERIPMAWGTTTDSLTPEINPFQYAREIKYLTLKDQTSYLIPDG